MVVVAGDMRTFLSGGAANHDPAASLGGIISTHDMISDGIQHNLFDPVTAAEASAGMLDYRCYYIKNMNTTDTWFGVEVWVQTAPSIFLYSIGLDAAGAGDGVTTGVATTIVNETTAPGSVTFSEPTGSPGLSIGNLTAGQVHAVWIRRIALASTSAAPDDFGVLRHSGTDV